MEKICVKCNLDGFGEDDKRCSECGSLLIEKPLAKAGKDTAKYSSQDDNRNFYHHGDKNQTVISGDSLNAQSIDNSKTETVVAGDSLNAQNIDNRTVTSNSTSTTTIHQSIVEETIDCPISRLTVKITKSAICKECNRRVSIDCFVRETLLCTDCHKESRKKETPHYTAPSINVTKKEKSLPAMVQTEDPEINQYVSQRGPVVERIRPETGNGTTKRRRKYIVLAAIGVIVIGAATFALNRPAQPNVPATPQELPVNAVPGEAVKPVVAPTAVSKPAASAASSTPAAKPAASAPTTPVKEPSAFDKGKEAFSSGSFAKANILFTQAVQEGNSAASYYLAQMYKDGKGVNKDTRQAFSHMLKAAEGGHADAFYAVAEMYRTGVGTETNRSIAKKWYEKAAVSDAADSDKAAGALTKFY